MLFNVTAARTALPACQGPGLNDRWAFDGSTPAGQAKLSALLSAYAMQKKLVVIGKGTCPDWGDTESVNWMRVVD